MKGTNLGELEEVVLLTTALLHDDAYGVAIQQEIKARCDRSISLSTVHAVLVRLAEKGYVTSRYAGSSTDRGGRRKHLFTLTAAGERALVKTYEMRNSLWNAIPTFSIGK